MSAKKVLPILVLLGLLLVSQTAFAQISDSQGLFNAIKKKDLEQAKKLVAANKSIVNNPIQFGLPLFWTAKYKANEIAKLLLENGADVNANSPSGIPVLYEILQRRGSEDVVLQILDKKPDLTACSRQGQNVLTLALSSSASVKTIERLLEMGVDPAKKNGSGQSAVMVAIQNRRADVFDLLFTNVDLKAVDIKGNSLLMNACQFGAQSIALRLIKRTVAEKIDIDARNKAQQTALHIASRYGQTTVMEKLLDAGASVDSVDGSNNTPLVFAVHAFKPNPLELLLNRGADVKQLYDINFSSVFNKNRNSYTLKVLFANGFKASEIEPAKQYSILATAINTFQGRGAATGRASNVEILSILFENGFDPNVVGGTGPDQGKLPIDRAIAKGLVPVTEFLARRTDLEKSKSKPEFLLEWACDNNAEQLAGKLLELKPVLANATFSSGRSALLAAAESGYTGLVNKLIASDANVNGSFEDGNSPLLIASAGGHGETVAALLKAGADANAADETGQTALHMACGSSSVQVVNVLIEAGANINASTKTKRTPLHVAAWNGATECVAAILAAKSSDVKIDVQDSDGWTPLHKAAFRGHVSVVTLLVKAGADKTVTTKAGMTALQLAEGKAQDNVGKRIIERLTRLYRDGKGVWRIREATADEVAPEVPKARPEKDRPTRESPRGQLISFNGKPKATARRKHSRLRLAVKQLMSIDEIERCKNRG